MSQDRKKRAGTKRRRAAALPDWIAGLFGYRELLRMGHLQRKDDLNLGLGWLYYALARILRPAQVVVIGSWRGFVPMVFARALQDNAESGEVLFIDPSLTDGFWKNRKAVARHFRSYGITNIRHLLMTTQEFVQSREYRALREIGIVFIDGYHTHEQAKFDYLAFAGLLAADGLILFHDTKEFDVSHRYGRKHAYVRTVRNYMEELQREPQLQVLDLPFGGGVALVRRVPARLASPPTPRRKPRRPASRKPGRRIRK